MGHELDANSSPYLYPWSSLLAHLMIQHSCFLSKLVSRSSLIRTSQGARDLCELQIREGGSSDTRQNKQGRAI